MTAQYVMIDNDVLEDAELSTRRNIPGLFVIGYVRTRKIEVWLSPEILDDMAEGDAMPETKWPWSNE